MTQPEALRLADRLETFLEIETNNQAAAELRRLHEESQALAQPEQEPVAWIERGIIQRSSIPFGYKGNLYTAPPKKEWVWLTEEEIIDSLKKSNLPSVFSYRMAARAIERKLKEKNT